jgi:hypothetical protein
MVLIQPLVAPAGRFVPDCIYLQYYGGFPNRWFTALTANIDQLAKQVDKWGYQLRIDLAHLNQPDPMASVTQESLIATPTRSHYFGSPSYRPWTSR